MTPLAKALFIFTSYGPLWLLMGVRFGVVESTAKLASWAPGLSIGFYVAAGASVFVFLGLLKICRKSNPVEIEIEGYVRKDDHILAYIVTYFPPLFSLNLGTPADLWSLAVIYATVAVVYIRLDAYYINPFFALAGYRVFEITTEGGKKTYAALIKRKVVLKKGAIISGPLWDDIFISEGEQ